MLDDQHSIDMLLRGVFSPFVCFECSLNLDLLLEGVVCCKPENKTNKEKGFEIFLVLCVIFVLQKTKNKEK